MALPGMCIDHVHQCQLLDKLILDLDSNDIFGTCSRARVAVRQKKLVVRYHQFMYQAGTSPGCNPPWLKDSWQVKSIGSLASSRAWPEWKWT